MEKQRENKNPCGYCGFRYGRDAAGGAAGVADVGARSIFVARTEARTAAFEPVSNSGSRKLSDSLFETGFPALRRSTAKRCTPVTIDLPASATPPLLYIFWFRQRYPRHRCRIRSGIWPGARISAGCQPRHGENAIRKSRNALSSVSRNILSTISTPSFFPSS